MTNRKTTDNALTGLTTIQLAIRFALPKKIWICLLALFVSHKHAMEISYRPSFKNILGARC